MQSIDNKIFQDVPEEIEESWRHGAILGGLAQGAYDRLAIADSYKLAGDILVQRTLDDVNLDGYQLVYPILFNYKHCLELYIKTIVPKKHSHKFSKDLIPMLSNWFKEQYKTDLPARFKEKLLELDDYDPEGTSFRYEEDGIFSRSTGDIGEFWVDFPHLKNVMDILQEDFHCLFKDNEDDTTNNVKLRKLQNISNTFLL